MDSPAADDPMADEAGVEDEITDDSCFHRSHVLRWMETVKGMVAGVAPLPPVYMILNRDLLHLGWGWTRLVPYRSGFVEWYEYKKYLGDYFEHNHKASLCAEQKTEPFKWIVAEKNTLIAAAKLCLKMEKALLKYCASFLTPDDENLIFRIKDQAKQMIQSEGDQSLVVTICLKCIAKEAELIYNYLPCDFDATREVAVCNKIRQSALNLMLYKGSEPAVAAGAMMGITTEAKFILELLGQEDHDVFLEFLTSESIRKCTASVLTQLGKEFSCETATVNNSSAWPMGVSDVRDVNSEVSGSMEDCTGMDEDCGNNQVEGVAKNLKNLKLVGNPENETRVATLMTENN